MLSSSLSVTLMKKSADSMPASRNAGRRLPESLITMQSRWLTAYLAVSGLRSIRTTFLLSAIR